MDAQRQFLTGRYQQLWEGSIDHVRAGDVQLDPLLAKGEPDQRRCLTVLLRPSAEVQHAVAGFLDQLREIDPRQYYYQPGELHVTVLALFTATIDHARFFARYHDYWEALNAVLACVPTFSIEFTGVTLTRDAIMIGGFPNNTVLNDTREILRNELRARGLTEGLDGRYVLQTAHLTAVRFRHLLQNSQSFADKLEAFRNHPFGRTPVKEFHLVRNDWYMSTLSVKVLERYQLSSSSTPQVSQPV